MVGDTCPFRKVRAATTIEYMVLSLSHFTLRVDRSGVAPHFGFSKVSH